MTVGLVLWLVCGLAMVGLFTASCGGSRPVSEDEFARLMNVGKNYYDKGEAQRAIAPFAEAVAINPVDRDARLNLANAYLLAGDATNTLVQAAVAVDLDHNSAAAHYLLGCGHLRLREFQPAVKALQTARDLNPKIGAVTFQLGRAHQELGQYEPAIALFQELAGFEPEHPAVHYVLGQALIRAGRQDEGGASLERHRQLQAERAGTIDEAKLERCEHTLAQAPFILEQPPVPGIRVTFTDATAGMLAGAERYQGPLEAIDYHRDGRNSLFVSEGEEGFRLLINSNGTFQPHTQLLPKIAGATYHRCLVADLQNDRYEDILVLGDQGSHLFRMATNAQAFDSTTFSRMTQVKAIDGVLVDIDFTGNLDLVAVNQDRQALTVMRNRGRLFFSDTTATSGVPASVTGAGRVAVDDWDNDDLLDVVVTREGQPPLLLLKERGGPLVPAETPADWPVAHALVFGDFNNDLRSDLVLAAPRQLVIAYNSLTNLTILPMRSETVRGLFTLDFDNDGWLDLVAYGDGLQVWRNLGRAGFEEVTAALKLDQLRGTVESLTTADFDLDGDTDLAVSIQGQGLRLLRNDGGHANLQLKVRLLGNRSNASGIGTRVEVTAGGLRIGRRVMRLPIEIGVGQHAKLESLNARWLNLSLNNVDVQVDPRSTVPLLELSIPEGSCPYLYAWNGETFEFVTDLLSAAPAGLRISDDRFVEADPDEFVWLGDEDQLPSLDGARVLQITEELREVLYLDAAQLVVVDHPADTEVYPTSKMVPGRPFPPHGIVTLRQPVALRSAMRSDGLNVTELLQEADHRFVSPVRLRPEPLRGLAEPYAITLDFGPLEVERPLVLGITAWLRFGGGLANVAGSLDPELPFPFPTLEVEVSPGIFEPVDVMVGTPAGKTKRMVVDLDGKLPAGSRRLRLATAYELHWDQIVLLEKADPADTRLTHLEPDVAELYWRGFSDFADLPWYRPLTPVFDQPRPNPLWRITPMGWCTRYGDVRELVRQRDDALALLNGGDALTLSFSDDRLPPKPEGHRRAFFLYSSGWDKDSDFHCAKGWLVDPIPWHGMDDQRYGQEPRPVIDGDWWIKQYNTRWVGPRTLLRPE
ncbi:MAG: VCBS repeat-containing protein [Verrucomicrobia bacterium]|nr:VCBS repeat-containing protein [Verrucomicrobiota bacterium]